MSGPDGKVIFITGAASGIGAAVALRAAESGYRVVLADRNYPGATELAEKIGPNAFATMLDVRSPTQWTEALDATWQRFGRLDVLINNAGIVHPGYSRDITVDQHRLTVEVNLLGPMTGMMLTLPRFKAQGSGHFLTVCSMTSFLPMTGMASYAGTKHALRAFHHGLALEERHSPLHFTIIHPGSTETPMLDQELRADNAMLAFTTKSVPAAAVADTIIRAIIKRPVEVVTPPLFGRLLRLIGSNPGIIRMSIEGAEAKGRKQQELRRRHESAT